MDGEAMPFPYPCLIIKHLPIPQGKLSMRTINVHDFTLIGDQVKTGAEAH